MEYYGHNDYRDYLSHHGILGMKWGKRNGPPYPIAYGAHSSSEKKAAALQKKLEKQKRFVSDLSNELDKTWDYGVLVGDKKVLDIDDFNWARDYRTTPIEKLEKAKIGVCWDFVNYQHDRLKKAGIKDSSYMIVMKLPTKDNPDRTITHTFTTYELGGKNYWLESAMWPKHGVHEIKDFKDAASQIHSQYTKEPKPYSLFKYNPEGLDKGLTDTEFFNKVTENNWVGDFNVKQGAKSK